MKLDVVTPEGAKVRGLDATDVTLPGMLGEMGILPGHEAFMAGLGIGVMTVAGPGGPQVYAIANGYVEVLGDVVRVLTESCEKPDEIDVERARDRLARASKDIAGLAPADGETYNVMLCSVRKAETRIRLAESSPRSQA